MNIHTRPLHAGSLVVTTEGNLTHDLLRQISGQLAQLCELLQKEGFTSDSVLDIDACSRLLKIKKATLYRMTSRKQLPHRKIGKKLVFLYGELMQWVKEQKNQFEPLQ